ncbi:MAG: hypothetical protein AB7P02_21890 [Alphaproteobacteria bacterium]
MSGILTGADVLLYTKGYHWPQETLTWAMVPELGAYAGAIRDAMARWDSASDLDLVEVGPSSFDGASIKLIAATKEGYSGYTYIVVDDGDLTKITQAVVELPTTLDADRISYVVTHEVGHALGLKHPIRLDLTPASQRPHAPAEEVTEERTVMGYYDHHDGGIGEWDLQAINALYGPERDHAIADTISGGDAINQLLGGPGDDLLYGNAGDDRIFGGRHADTIFGGRGNDLVSGDQGDDDLSGNLGDDVLTGGAGRDVFHVGQGHDVITDFQAEVDRIVALDDYRVVRDGRDSVLVGDGWTARLLDVVDFA